MLFLLRRVKVSAVKKAWMWSNLCAPDTTTRKRTSTATAAFICRRQLASSCYSYPKAQMEMMKMAGVTASSAAGRCDLHLCWQSCQEPSSCISPECRAVHWHFITATRITVDLLFSLIVWQPCDIFTSRLRDASTGTRTCVSWVKN